jgi:hypothetical protein
MLVALQALLIVIKLLFVLRTLFAIQIITPEGQITINNAKQITLNKECLSSVCQFQKRSHTKYIFYFGNQI